MAEKTTTKPPKGTRDFLPEDVRRREYVTRIIRDVYEAHGFEPLETPTFERLETLLGKYGEEGDQLVFKILHRGEPLVTGIREASAHIQSPSGIVTGRSGETAPGAEKMLADMGLRYDLTVPLARVYAEYQAKLGAMWKRYQIQPVWRADTPGKGRFREFYQCDVDVVGSNELVVEAEVIGAVSECMLRLGFTDFQIQINHRALLRTFIEIAGIDRHQEGEAIVAIDKLDKIQESGVRKELEQKGITGPQQDKLLAFVLSPDDAEARVCALLEGHEAGMKALRDVQRVRELSDLTPARGHVRFNTSLARGLGYYTGCIFELAVKDLAGSLGGGGRYDNLIGMFLGRDVPACGFSLGLERILVVMEERGMFPARTGGAEVVVAGVEAEAMEDALAIAYELRKVGLRVELYSRPEKPGKVRKSADERGIAHAVIVQPGKNESINLWSRREPEKTSEMVPRTELAARIRAQG
jgi:histidyl-tRNA synthetase